MEQPHWLVVEGTQGDANFRVGLQKYVIPAPLYINLLILCLDQINWKYNKLIVLAIPKK